MFDGSSVDWWKEKGLKQWRVQKEFCSSSNLTLYNTNNKAFKQCKTGGSCRINNSDLYTQFHWDTWIWDITWETWSLGTINYMEQSPSSDAHRFSASQEIPCILRKPKVYYRIYKSRSPVLPSFSSVAFPGYTL